MCYFTSCYFFTPALAGGFSLYSEGQQVSLFLKYIQIDLRNAVVWIFSILQQIFSSSDLFSQLEETFPSEPSINGTTLFFSVLTQR